MATKEVIVAIGSDLGLLGGLPIGIIGTPYSATLTAYGATIITISLVSEDSPDDFVLVDNTDNTATLTCDDLTTSGYYEFVFRLKDEETRRWRRVVRTLQVTSVPIERITEEDEQRITEDGEIRLLG